MQRLLITMLFATLAGALVFGAAASMNVNSTQLGSGSDNVTACDSDGVTTSYTIDNTNAAYVDTLTVSDIADGSGSDGNCSGQDLHVTVFDDEGNVEYSNTALNLPVSRTATWDLGSTDLPAAEVDTIVVTITG